MSTLYPTAIRLAELEEVLTQALSALKTQYGSQGEIPLEHDFYWDIVLPEQLYNPEQDPCEVPDTLTLGSLCEDSQIVHESLARGVLPCDLIKAAMLLRYLGQTQTF